MTAQDGQLLREFLEERHGTGCGQSNHLLTHEDRDEFFARHGALGIDILHEVAFDPTWTPGKVEAAPVVPPASESGQK